MTFEEFEQSLEQELPHEYYSEELQALWWAGKGEWKKAHHIAQNISTADGSWIHAYLHRVSGDDGNAAYWYSHAGKSFCHDQVEHEWEALVKHFLTL